MRKPRFIKPPKEILKDLVEPEFSWMQIIAFVVGNWMIDAGNGLRGVGVILVFGILSVALNDRFNRTPQEKDG
jgi:hypothetical protein